MPFVTLTVHQSTPAATRRVLLDAVHASLVAVGVPVADRFQRVLALADEDLVFDPHYPEEAGSRAPRDRRFAIVEVLWSVGRSVKVKKQMLDQLHKNLSEGGFDPEQLMLVFKEVAWENWSFAGTRTLHA
jgi:phenylpyruvate tautomerase PptA (4-oxalocrotonate tautomerase family)